MAEEAEKIDEREIEHLLLAAVRDYAIFALDTQGRVVSWNRGAERMKGYTADEIRGRPFTIFYTPEDIARGRPQRVLSEAAEHGRFETEGWRVRKDGSRFWAHVTITALTDQQGSLRGFAKVTRDISAMRAAAEQRAAAERELAVMRRELLREERRRTLSETAAALAHELNNTLNGAMLRLYLLKRRGAASEDINEVGILLDQARNSIARLQEVAREADSSKILPVNLKQLIGNTVQMFKSEWLRDEGKAAIEIICQVPELPLVRADPADVRYLILGLLINASEAMEETGGAITITTTAGLDSIELSIADQGRGLPLDKRARLFEPFFTTKPGHAGLGLAVARQIVERLGGTIQANLEVKQGALFTLIFPRGDRPKAVPSGRVLLIDDDRDNLEALRSVLEMEGFEVSTAASGEEGLHLFTRSPFALVLCDLGMPGMNGWEVARRIRMHDPLVPFYLVTGWAHQIPADDERRGQISGVLAKPIDVPALLGVIGWTRERRETAQAASGMR